MHCALLFLTPIFDFWCRFESSELYKIVTFQNTCIEDVSLAKNEFEHSQEEVNKHDATVQLASMPHVSLHCVQDSTKKSQSNPPSRNYSDQYRIATQIPTNHSTTSAHHPSHPNPNHPSPRSHTTPHQDLTPPLTHSLATSPHDTRSTQVSQVPTVSASARSTILVWWNHLSPERRSPRTPARPWHPKAAMRRRSAPEAIPGSP